MKILKYLMATMLLSALFFATSCEKDDKDTQKPIITISAPEENEVLYIGSEIHFEVDFSDDVELKSYKVDIHSNFDGHDHKSALTDDSVAFTFQKSWNFDAGLKNSHVHHHEIVIPSEIDGKEISQGDYHFMVYCTDAAGNESWVAAPVKILKSTDLDAPTFSNIVAPTNNQVFANGQTITISGTVSDNEHLDGLFVAIMPEGATNEQVNPTDCFAVMLHEHDAVHEQQTYNFTASINVGQLQDNNTTPKNITWTAGNYFLIVKSPDESGNVGFSTQYPIVIE